MDDPCLGGMHFELAFRQPRLKFSLEGLSFFLGPTVHQPIVSIPTPWEVRVCPFHPEIKCVVQEQIRKNRTNYFPNAKGNFQFERVITGWRNTPILDLRLKG
jgi:hypothetical protein